MFDFGSAAVKISASLHRKSDFDKETERIL
jgi:hypothetical protein